jgi:transcriptional regulator with XRE-family HTH domain
MNLGSRIAAWRAWKGWTQSQLAEAAGVSRASMCQYEGNGKYQTSPSQDNLEAIVDALGLTMTRFYGRLPKTRRAA